jgi:hypothetical protein
MIYNNKISNSLNLITKKIIKKMSRNPICYTNDHKSPATENPVLPSLSLLFKTHYLSLSLSLLSLSLSFITPHRVLSLPHPFCLFAIMAPLSLSLLFSPLSSLVFFALPTLICFLSLGWGAYYNPRLSVLLLLAEPALAVPSAVKPVIPNDRC